MPGVLHAVSDVLPMSYAVDAMRHLTQGSQGSAVVARDLAVILSFALFAVWLGAVTLRRRTD